MPTYSKLLLALPVLLLAACASDQTAPLPISRTEDLLYAAPLSGSAAGWSLDVYAPAGDGAWPTALLLHGGGGSKDQTAYVEFSQRLAEQGVVVFTPTYPVGDPARMGQADGEPIRRSSEAINCAARFAAAQASDYEGDGSRVTIIGHSAGGYFGLLQSLAGEGLAAHWQAFASQRGGPAGQVDCSESMPAPVIGGFVGYNGAYFALSFFVGEADAELWEVVNPDNYVDRSPDLRLRFIFGSEDDTQPAWHIQRSQAFIETLAGAGFAAEHQTVKAEHAINFEGEPWADTLAATLAVVQQ